MLKILLSPAIFVFARWFLTASGVCALSYMATARARLVGQESSFFPWLVGCVALYFALFSLSVPIGLMMLRVAVPALVLTVPASCCEEARHQNDDWRWHFCVSLLTALLALGIAGTGTALLHGTLALVSSGAPRFLGFWGGLVLGPPSISFFRWMIPHLELRPGFDRPLTSGEDAPNAPFQS